MTRMTDLANGAATTVTKYYYALGRVVASRTGTIGTAGTLTFYAADHLGSTVATVSGTTGAILSQQQYYPFGSPRTGTPPERGYTGQQQETAFSTLGMYYYHARFYSPVVGHFASADPIAGDGPNRLSYVENKPLTLTDPSGLRGLLDGLGSEPIDPSTPYEDLLACAGDLVSCFWFSAAGDAEQYIQLVADFFYLPPEVLAAIVLNEYLNLTTGRGLIPIGGDELDGTDTSIPDWVPIIGGIQVGKTVGIAQINIDDAMRVENGRGFSPDLYKDRSLTIARLLEPRWAVFYAAAILYDHAVNTFYSPEPIRDSDYIVAYRFGLEGWVQWHDVAGGCDTCGIKAPAQIDAVRSLYSTSVQDLARVITYELPK